MKLTIKDPRAFADALREVKLSNGRRTLPIISGTVLVKAEKNGHGPVLLVRVNELDYEASKLIDERLFSVEDPGEAVLPLGGLDKALRAVSSATLWTENTETEVKATATDPATTVYGCKARLATSLGEVALTAFVAAEYPASLTKEIGDLLFTAEEGALRRALERAVFCASTDDKRYVINSVLIEYSLAGFCVVATDGRRLALNTLPVSSACATKAFRAVLPIRAAQKLLSLLGKSARPVLVTRATEAMATDPGERLTFVTQSGVILSTRQVEGTYPNYRQVIPSDAGDVTLVIDRENLLAAVKAAEAQTGVKSNSVKFAIDKGKVKLTARNDDGAESTFNVDGKSGSGAVTIAFDGSYVVDVLTAVKEPVLAWRFKDGETPGVLEHRDSGFLYVLMPMRMS